MANHYTYKGKAVDMGAMLMMNEHAVALGNANMNARGDILGTGGKVIKTNEQITEEHYQQNQAPVVETDEDFAVDYNDTPFQQESAAPVVEDMSLDMFTADEEPAPEPVAPKKRRKAPAAPKE